MNNNFEENQSQQKISHEKFFAIQGDNLKSLTHRSIVAITCLNKDTRAKVYGSGVLISKNIVLTAAHNVYDKSTNQENIQFKVYLGAVNNIVDHYYEVESLKYQEQYCQSNDSNKFQLDYALLKLKQKVDYPQFMKICLKCPQCLCNSNIKLSTFGYPSNYKDNYQPMDKFGNQFVLKQYGIVQDKRIIKSDNDKDQIIKYSIRTLPGQSGSPLIIDDKIIGISVGYLIANIGQSFGKLMTLLSVTSIINWIYQLGGHLFRISQKDTCEHLISDLKQFIRKKKLGDFLIDKSGTEKSSINIEQFSKLTDLLLDQNNIANINIACNKLLKILSVSNNSLHQIDISSNINLKEVNLQANKLAAIDLTKNKDLKYLNIQHNQLTSIDLDQNTKLIKVCLSNNQLSAINVKNNAKLTTLRLSQNRISEIDVTNNIKLKQLQLSNNQIIQIDLSQNSRLQQLQLQGNFVQSIDISKNKQLVWLQASNNKLSSIDVSKNIKLRQLNLQNNQIAQIDLSNNINLTHLNIQSNQLSNIDLKDNTKLASLNADSNCLKQIDLSFDTQKSIKDYLSKFTFANQDSKSCQVTFHPSKEDQTSYNSKNEKIKQLKKALGSKYWKKSVWSFFWGKKNRESNQHNAQYVFA